MQSKYAEALVEFNVALRVRIAAFGKNHPEVAATRNNIANVYQEQSKYVEALVEYSKALRVTIAAFGKDHPEVAATRNPSTLRRWWSTARHYRDDRRLREGSYGGCGDPQ
jgi:hypothetical protein